MLSIGIDLGGTNIACGLVDEYGRIVAKKSTKTMVNRPAEAILRDMADLPLALISENGLSVSDIAFCGIASPGRADSVTGVVDYTFNLPTLCGVQMVEPIRRWTGIKNVGLDNDANCAAKAEAEVGAAKGCEYSVLVTLGTGVGGGIVSHGKILHGVNFTAAEVGHMVIQKDGPLCTCGRRGCFEAMASVTALIRITRRVMRENPDSAMWRLSPQLEIVSGRTAFDGMRLNDEAAKKVVNEYVENLACGLTNIINIIQPDVLCVGGGISAEGETLLAPVRAIVEKDQYSRDCRQKTELKTAQLGNDAGIIGAAFLGR